MPRHDSAVAVGAFLESSARMVAPPCKTHVKARRLPCIRGRRCGKPAETGAPIAVRANRSGRRSLVLRLACRVMVMSDYQRLLISFLVGILAFLAIAALFTLGD